MQIGRNEIFTDYAVVTSENVVKVLQDAMASHMVNASRIDFLMNYEAGYQPIARKKTFRPDIDAQCVDNVANEITEFKLGFKWGCPITLVQRGETDSGKENEVEGIALLNEQYENVAIKRKTQQLARFIEICGVGYTYVDVNMDYEDGDSYFKLEVLDPRCTFVVRSTVYLDHRIVMAVTYRTDTMGNRFFTCFTPSERFEIVAGRIINPQSNVEEDVWYHDGRSGEENPLHEIPVIEWIRSYDRMGCFERQIPDMDMLNLLESDFVNDVDQNTQSVWWGNDVNFPVDENGEVVKPKSGEWMLTYSTENGKPSVQPLAVTYDYSGMLSNILNKRALILQKAYVPQRNDNSGGSTGVAMSDATGWSSAESSATKDECITSGCKMDEVRVILKALQVSPFVPQDSPLLKLKVCDMQPNIIRQKSYELSNKANAIVTLINAGFNGEQVLKNIPFFSDVQQAWADSKIMVEKIQKSSIKSEESNNNNNQQQLQSPLDQVKSDRLMQDSSDQNENSPKLDKE